MIVLYLKNVKANIAIDIHIGMEAEFFKHDFGGFEKANVGERVEIFKPLLLASSDCYFLAEYVVS